jgi:hypothetical protein
MNFADLLTYADIQQVKKIADHYGCVTDQHSKNDMITSLLHHLGRKSQLVNMVEGLSPEEFRFLQQICFDSRDLFSQEDLLGKGKAALGDGEESPRRLVISGMQRGWIFPGVTQRHRTLFQIPADLRRRFLELLAEPYRMNDGMKKEEPFAYRNEEGHMIQDLIHFLKYLRHGEIPLTSEGGIYKQHQRQIFKMFAVQEELVDKKGWRFGFGRRYHQYPDRFSLLYDYAYYKGYIIELLEEGALRLTEKGIGKIEDKQRGEDRELYRFWLRLYRRPIPHVAVIVQWVDLLCRYEWIGISQVEEAVSGWLRPFYYEDKKSLLQRLLKMMLHLGMIRLGERKNGEKVIRMNEIGHTWITGVSGFSEKALDKRYTEVSPAQ